MGVSPVIKGFMIGINVGGLIFEMVVSPGWLIFLKPYNSCTRVDRDNSDFQKHCSSFSTTNDNSEGASPKQKRL